MNERIRLLAEQAKKYALDAMIKITDKEQALKVYSESYDTKFAELIVQECIDTYDHWATHSMDKTAFVVARTHVKEHFGIEQ